MRHFQRTALSIAAAQVALLWSGQALAQAASAPVPAAAASAAAKAAQPEQVIVTGQRAALSSAQKLKQNSDEIVDSIVADDIGKLPDRSVTEVLQRIVGVTIDRTMAKNDPEHFSIEGSGVMIRGLTYVRSELNGRDSFSANGGRSLNFEDVPPELMAGVDVYKSPSAEQIEGSIGGLVNLRTAMPFDFKERRVALSASTSHSTLAGKNSPSLSGLYADRIDTELGQLGWLVDLAHSESKTRTDAFQVEPYYPRSDIVPGKTVWIPKGSQWRTLEFDRKRDGQYAALQWRKDDLESSLTYFKSKYKMTWAENAIFAQSSPYNITVDDGATYSDSGALLKGTLRDAKDGGINFGADTRVADRTSSTQDVSWKLDWKASDKLSLHTDLQFIRANTKSFDSTVATGVQMAKENIDLTGSVPQLNFDAADLAALANPANYYWAFTMEHKDKAVATSKAWRLDGKYSFEHPFFSDVRFGLRLTDRDALTQKSNPDYNWSPITQPWQQGWDISHLAYLGDPRFSGNTHLETFKNFFGGKRSVPSLIFPDVSTAAGYPDSYAALHKYHDILCAEAHGGKTNACSPWTPATFGTDPAGTNDQRERTQAVYSQLRFAADELPLPVDGNVGLRLVHTVSSAHGYTVFNSKDVPVGATGVPVPVIPSFSEAATYDNSYTNVLPSLNLRMKQGEQLQYRFAYSQGLSRPDFSQLQGYTKLSQDFSATTTTTPSGSSTVVNSVSRTGEAAGNPLLKPVRSSQVDLTAEWYPSKSSSVTLATFNKELKDVIINQTFIKQLPDAGGTLQDFLVTGPVNGANGRARGFELAGQTYFDSLPGWLAGFGVQANYTYVDSRQTLKNPVNAAYCSGGNSAANLNLNLNGCDTDGRTFGNLPLANMSKNAWNLALMYDRGPLSARVAYSWRSKNLQAVNVNGTQGGDGTDTNPASATLGQQNVAWGLPVWAAAYGQLDAGVFYKIDEHLTIGLEGQNLTNETFRQLMQQHTGDMGRAWFSTGPRYSAQVRYQF